MDHHYQMRYRKGDLEVVVESDEKAFILEQFERLRTTATPERVDTLVEAIEGPAYRGQVQPADDMGVAAYAALTRDRDTLARWVL